jgi:hypothetical protein
MKILRGALVAIASAAAFSAASPATGGSPAPAQVCEVQWRDVARNRTIPISTSGEIFAGGIMGTPILG